MLHSSCIHMDFWIHSLLKSPFLSSFTHLNSLTTGYPDYLSGLLLALCPIFLTSFLWCFLASFFCLWFIVLILQNLMKKVLHTLFDSPVSIWSILITISTFSQADRLCELKICIFLACLHVSMWLSCKTNK